MKEPDRFYDPDETVSALSQSEDGPDLRESVCKAISMIQAHIDKYHDCDLPEGTEAYPELKSLREIMYHLMGSI